ncbi:S8 family serine peptidase [Streptomyces benahoarensis]|uniref:S8 family serine peptidase n=1 Tax=Streptomyces benahoarensis TaxID=2595054 RepID=A0A553ZFP1_9ACTN|nr:S8 family serine peptidase [Streptomyces benahoarensis]TSB21396.1 S8 family serine peptidase [Streptomyces benahoarensis]TSB40262.1 S8 family serine peptidase [Streptomyces benahoarensis]
MSFTRKLRVVSGAVVAGALLFGTAPVASADQIRDAQWPLKAFDAEKIWELSTGKGVTVAVIDDGVDSRHPDLKGNVLPGKDFNDGGSADPEDGDTHGTQMASEIAGHGHGPGGASGVKGLAPDAKILPVRDSGTTEKGFGPAIRYSVDHGASVINISQAVSTKSDGDVEAIAYALKHDVLVVTSSGNEGKGAEAIEYPGSYPGVLTVGGVQNSGEIWSKSNYGPPVLLSAPAVGIVSAGNSGTSMYQKGTGTSDATAYVSASIALLREKFPDLSVGQLVNRLTKSAGLPASAKGSQLPDQKYGYGFIQPLAALKRDIPAGPKNGPLKMPTAASSPAAGDSAVSQGNDGSGDSTQAASKAGMSPLFIVIIVVGGLVVIGIVLAIVLMVVRRKGRRNGPPPGGPGAPGFGGQQVPYQQQGGVPGQYSAPPGQYPPPPGQ